MEVRVGSEGGRAGAALSNPNVDSAPSSMCGYGSDTPGFSVRTDPTQAFILQGLLIAHQVLCIVRRTGSHSSEPFRPQ